MIEDEADLRRVVAHNLETAGYEVRTAATGEDGLRIFDDFAPQLVLLDLMLPDTPGTEVCRRIRGDQRHPQPAVIIVTAKGEEIDRVVGFELGADDYVVKPFSVRELLLRAEARVKARRAPTPTAGGEAAPPRAATDAPLLTMGPLQLDPVGYHVYVGGEEINVSILEMKLLTHLIEHRGQVRSRRQLLANVWGYQPDVTSRTVDTHVKRLRDKLGAAGVLIETVRGIGYRLADVEAMSDPAAHVKAPR